jgi:hypothetical protein
VESKKLAEALSQWRSLAVRIGELEEANRKLKTQARLMQEELRLLPLAISLVKQSLISIEKYYEETQDTETQDTGTSSAHGPKADHHQNSGGSHVGSRRGNSKRKERRVDRNEGQDRNKESATSAQRLPASALCGQDRSEVPSGGVGQNGVDRTINAETPGRLEIKSELNETKRFLFRLESAIQDIQRSRGLVTEGKQKLTFRDLGKLLAETDDSLIGLRDRAILLLGWFACTIRRSELVGLSVSDLRFTKTDLRIGAQLILRQDDSEICPVGNLEKWIKSAGIAGGPLFRSINRHGQVQAGRLSGIDVARIVKKLAGRAGLDAAKYAANSLLLVLVRNGPP